MKYKLTEKWVKFKISSPTNPAKIKIQKERRGLSHLRSFCVCTGTDSDSKRQRDLLK